MAPEKLLAVIVGCGRLGSYLANRLSRDGHAPWGVAPAAPPTAARLAAAERPVDGRPGV